MKRLRSMINFALLIACLFMLQGLVTHASAQTPAQIEQLRKARREAAEWWSKAALIYVKMDQATWTAYCNAGYQQQFRTYRDAKHVWAAAEKAYNQSEKSVEDEFTYYKAKKQWHYAEHAFKIGLLGWYQQTYENTTADFFWAFAEGCFLTGVAAVQNLRDAMDGIITNFLQTLDFKEAAWEAYMALFEGVHKAEFMQKVESKCRQAGLSKESTKLLANWFWNEHVKVFMKNESQAKEYAETAITKGLESDTFKNQLKNQVAKSAWAKGAKKITEEAVQSYVKDAVDALLFVPGKLVDLGVTAAMFYELTADWNMKSIYDQIDAVKKYKDWLTKKNDPNPEQTAVQIGIRKIDFELIKKKYHVKEVSSMPGPQELVPGEVVFSEPDPPTWEPRYPEYDINDPPYISYPSVEAIKNACDAALDDFKSGKLTRKEWTDVKRQVRSQMISEYQSEVSAAKQKLITWYNDEKSRLYDAWQSWHLDWEIDDSAYEDYYLPMLESMYSDALLRLDVPGTDIDEYYETILAEADAFYSQLNREASSLGDEITALMTFVRATYDISPDVFTASFEVPVVEQYALWDLKLNEQPYEKYCVYRRWKYPDEDKVYGGVVLSAHAFSSVSHRIETLIEAKGKLEVGLGCVTWGNLASNPVWVPYSGFYNPRDAAGLIVCGHTANYETAVYLRDMVRQLSAIVRQALPDLQARWVELEQFGKVITGEYSSYLDRLEAFADKSDRHATVIDNAIGQIQANAEMVVANVEAMSYDQEFLDWRQRWEARLQSFWLKACKGEITVEVGEGQTMTVPLMGEYAQQLRNEFKTFVNLYRLDEKASNPAYSSITDDIAFTRKHLFQAVNGRPDILVTSIDGVDRSRFKTGAKCRFLGYQERSLTRPYMETADGKMVPTEILIKGTASWGEVGNFKVEISLDGSRTWHRVSGRDSWSFTLIPGRILPYESSKNGGESMIGRPTERYRMWLRATSEDGYVDDSYREWYRFNFNHEGKLLYPGANLDKISPPFPKLAVGENVQMSAQAVDSRGHSFSVKPEWELEHGLWTGMDYIWQKVDNFNNNVGKLSLSGLFKATGKTTSTSPYRIKARLGFHCMTVPLTITEAGVRPTVAIIVSKPGYLAVSKSLTANKCAKYVTISGTVTSATTHRPIAKVDITVGEISAKTDERGYYKIKATTNEMSDTDKLTYNVKLEPSQATMEASKEGYYTESQSTHTGAASFTLKGKVTDAASGETLEGVRIAQTDEGGGETLTNSAGEYSLVVGSGQKQLTLNFSLSRKPSTGDLKVTKAGYIDAVAQVSYAFEKGRIIGRVTDFLTGTPVSSAEVEIVGTGTITTDADGRFELVIGDGGEQFVEADQQLRMKDASLKAARKLASHLKAIGYDVTSLHAFLDGFPDMLAATSAERAVQSLEGLERLAAAESEIVRYHHLAGKMSEELLRNLGDSMRYIVQGLMLVDRLELPNAPLDAAKALRTAIKRQLIETMGQLLSAISGQASPEVAGQLGEAVDVLVNSLTDEKGGLAAASELLVGSFRDRAQEQLELAVSNTSAGSFSGDRSSLLPQLDALFGERRAEYDNLLMDVGYREQWATLASAGKRAIELAQQAQPDWPAAIQVLSEGLRTFSKGISQQGAGRLLTLWETCAPTLEEAIGTVYGNVEASAKVVPPHPAIVEYAPNIEQHSAYLLAVSSAGETYAAALQELEAALAADDPGTVAASIPALADADRELSQEMAASKAIVDAAAHKALRRIDDFGTLQDGYFAALQTSFAERLNLFLTLGEYLVDSSDITARDSASDQIGLVLQATDIAEQTLGSAVSAVDQARLAAPALVMVGSYQVPEKVYLDNTFTLAATILNSGSGPASDVVATLTADSSLTPLSARETSLGDLDAGESVDVQWELRLDQANPGAVSLIILATQASDALSRSAHIVLTTAESTPPVIVPMLPQEGATISDPQPAISATLSDAVSGIDETTIVMKLDEEEVISAALGNLEASYDPASGKLSYTPAEALANGLHKVAIQVADNDGNRAYTKWNFEISPTVQLAIGSLKASPTPFSPGNLDGVDDVCTISYFLPKSATVSVTIYDSQGAVFKTLVAGEERPAGLNQEKWTGGSDEGAMAPGGTYTFTIVATDASGTREVSGIIAVTAGTLAISGVEVCPVSVSTLKPSPQVTIAYTLSGDAKVLLRIYQGSRIADESVPLREIEDTRASRGRNLIIWDMRDASSVPVGEGEYVYELWAEDGTSLAILSPAGVIAVDNTPPPAPVQLLVSPQVDGSLKLSWSPVEGEVLSGYNIYRSDSLAGSYEKINTSVPMKVTEFIDSQVSLGEQYWYQVTALDEAGNESQSSSPAMGEPQDLLAPSFSLISTQPDPAKAGPVEIKVSTSEKLKDIPNLTVNGNPAQLVSQEGDLTYVFSYPVSEEDQQGQATLIASGTDLAGNSASGQIGVFIIDTVAPEPPVVDQVSSPTNVSQQTLTGEMAADAAAVLVNGDSAGVTYPSTSRWSCSIDLVEGVNTISIVAQDAAGNSSSPVTVEILLDTVLPEFTIAVIPNPVHSNYIDIAIIPSEKLLPDVPQVQVELQAATTPLEMTSIGKNIWIGDYTVSLDASGEAKVMVSGSDPAGNIGSGEAFFLVQGVKAGTQARLQGTLMKVALEIPAGAVESSMMIVVVPEKMRLTDAGRRSIEELPAQYWADGTVAVHTPVGIYPKDVVLKCPATLTISPDDSVHSQPLWGIYRWDDRLREWRFIGNSVKSGRVCAQISQFGTFAMGRDTSLPFAQRVMPADGSVLETVRPTIGAVLEISDNDISVDNITVTVDGRAMPPALLTLNEQQIRYVPPQDLLEGTHRVVVRARDRHNNQVPIAEWDFFISPTAFSPSQSWLGQNYPNPSNPGTRIPYKLHRETSVRIVIYNNLGQTVRTIELGPKPAGSYTTPSTAAYWDGTNNQGEAVSSGVYFYLFSAGELRRVKKLIVVR